jgi:hypothetical protein
MPTLFGEAWFLTITALLAIYIIVEELQLNWLRKKDLET